MSSPDIQTIKQSIDLMQIVLHYCEVKRVSNNDFVAVTNPIREERTSSLHFYIDSQKWHDFGSGESGDVFDFIQKVERCTLSAAKEKALILTGKTPLHVSPAKPSCPVEIIDSKALENEFNRFEKMTLKNNLHKTEILQVVPYWLITQANKEDLAFFQSIVRYDEKLHTMVTGWYKNTDTALQMVTYKWRRKAQGKWINRAGTHPNGTAFSRITDSGKVYVVEGAHDALTATLLGLNFVAIPSTSYNNEEDFKRILRDGDEVVYIVEDAQGFKCMKKLNAMVKGEMLRLADGTAKMDLSDFVFTKNSIEEVINGLSIRK